MMTGQIRNQREERELDSYVESPTRANKTAQETTVTNTVAIDKTGLATSAKQDSLLAELQQKADLTDTQPVSVASLPLPSGASTSALQTAGNSILSTILSAIQGVLNIRSLVFATDKVDVTGSIVTANIGILVRKNTYAAAVVAFAYPANGTDIFTVSGVDGKKIRIKHLSLNGVQQNIGARDVVILKRSSLNTGGTFTAITPTPLDSDFPASNVVVRYYTANPATLGTLSGLVQAEKVVIGAGSGVNVSGDDLKMNFGNEDEAELVLNGVNEIMAVNMNGVTSSQNLINIDCIWIEENI